MRRRAHYAGDFTLKRRQAFFGHTTPEKLQNATISGHFGFVFEENSGRESHDCRDFYDVTPSLYAGVLNSFG